MWANLPRATENVHTTFWIERNYSKTNLFICWYAFFCSGSTDFFQRSYLIKFKFLQSPNFHCNLHSLSLYNFFGLQSNLHRFSCCNIFYKLHNSWRRIFWFSPKKDLYDNSWHLFYQTQNSTFYQLQSIYISNSWWYLYLQYIIYDTSYKKWCEIWFLRLNILR